MQQLSKADVVGFDLISDGQSGQELIKDLFCFDFWNVLEEILDLSDFQSFYQHSQFLIVVNESASYKNRRLENQYQITQQKSQLQFHIKKKIPNDYSLMQHRRNINSLSMKPCQKTLRPPQQKTNELELQLNQARGHISVLKSSNNTLLAKLSACQRQLQDKRIVEDQLNFRREEEKQMQDHMENYHNINQRLREKVSILQNKLKFYEKTSHSDIREARKPSLDYLGSSDENRNPCNVRQHRKSIGSSSEAIQRENHPLTPKNRVKIDFSLFEQPNIQGKKRVFF